MRWLAMVLIAAGSLIGCAQDESPDPGDPHVDVPDVRNMSLADGARELQELGLCVLVKQGDWK
jgi:beta-lactam-binding protein with PASTA domain